MDMIQSTAGKMLFLKTMKRELGPLLDRFGICEALGFMAVSLGLLIIIVASAI
jgi:hypothetical protein